MQQPPESPLPSCSLNITEMPIAINESRGYERRIEVLAETDALSCSL